MGSQGGGRKTVRKTISQNGNKTPGGRVGQKNFVYSVVNGTADQTPAKEEVSTICPVIVKMVPPRMV